MIPLEAQFAHPTEKISTLNNNPISGDAIAGYRAGKKYSKAKEEVMSKSLNILGANKGKAKDVAAVAKAVKEAKGLMY
jgi:hypothetical protein